MVIAVNTRFLLRGYLEGYGNFVYECFTRLTKLFPEHTFIFIFDRPYDPLFIFSENIVPVILSPKARHPLLWWIWFNVRIPNILKKYKADVFVSADGFCSLFTNIPQCLVLHDLAFLHYPRFIKQSHLLFYKRFTPSFLKKATRIATVSDFSKKDIIGTYKCNPEKIDIVYNGVSKLFQPVGSDERESIKQEYARGYEYFLCTSAIHPRKNLLHVLKAFSVFKKRQKSNMQLVIAGRLAWQHEEFTELLKTYRFKEDVNLLGYIEQARLAKVTAGAYAMIYASLFEGFGVPMIESMKCMVPVLTSNVSAMPEIAGEAALYFDPNNFNDIANTMMLIFKDENLRQQFIQKGLVQSANFSWEKTSQLLWKSILTAGTL